MPNYDYLCYECEKIHIILVPYEDRDSSEILCPECGIPGLERRMIMPNITKASYPDGTTNRFQNFREAVALQKEAADSKSDRKKEIAKEIKKLGVTIAK